MGLTRIDGGIHVTTVAAAKACSLLLFAKEEKSGKGVKFHEVFHIPFPETGKTGHVWSMTLKGDFTSFFYAFEADGKRFPDPYGLCSTSGELYINSPSFCNLSGS